MQNIKISMTEKVIDRGNKTATTHPIRPTTVEAATPNPLTSTATCDLGDPAITAQCFDNPPLQP
jgi:hypothetical protein